MSDGDQQDDADAGGRHQPLEGRAVVSSLDRQPEDGKRGRRYSTAKSRYGTCPLPSPRRTAGRSACPRSGPARRSPRGAGPTRRRRPRAQDGRSHDLARPDARPGPSGPRTIPPTGPREARVRIVRPRRRESRRRPGATSSRPERATSWLHPSAGRNQLGNRALRLDRFLGPRRAAGASTAKATNGKNHGM